MVSSKVVEGKESAEDEKFGDYFDYAETIRTVPSHRALALLRGRNAGMLDVKLGLGEEPTRRRRIRRKRRIARHFGIARSRAARPTSGWPTCAAGPGA